MKPGKGDVSGSYTSDAFLNAPDSLFERLASVFRSWLIHGTVTLSLLACSRVGSRTSPRQTAIEQLLELH